TSTRRPTCHEVVRLEMLVRRASGVGFLAHSGREVLSRCVVLYRFGDTLTFRGELEPGAPSPLGEVVVVRDVALVQASQGFPRRQTPPLDRLRPRLHRS